MNLHDLDAGATMAHRQAALALLALSPADREWLLSRLASPERERLEMLQGQVRELGIPVDPAMAHALVGARLSADDVLRCVSAQRLAALLDREPVGLMVSVALTFGEGPRGALLDALAPARRRQVEDGLRSRATPGAPALEASLRRVLAARLGAADRPAQAAPHGIWARAGRSLRIAFSGWRGSR